MAEDDEAARIATIDEKIKTAVQDAISQLKEALTGGAGNGSESEPDQPASMSAEVRRELEKLRAEEAKTQAEQQRDERIGTLEQKVERPPREYRRATKFMRWDTEADR